MMLLVRAFFLTRPRAGVFDRTGSLAKPERLSDDAGGHLSAGLERLGQFGRRGFLRRSIRLMEMKRLRGEGESNAQVLGQPEDIEKEPLPLAQFDRPIGTFQEAVQEHVERTGRELIEVDVIIILAGVGMAAD